MSRVLFGAFCDELNKLAGSSFKSEVADVVKEVKDKAVAKAKSNAEAPQSAKHTKIKNRAGIAAGLAGVLAGGDSHLLSAGLGLAGMVGARKAVDYTRNSTTRHIEASGDTLKKLPHIAKGIRSLTSTVDDTAKSVSEAVNHGRT